VIRREPDGKASGVHEFPSSFAGPEDEAPAGEVTRTSRAKKSENSNGRVAALVMITRCSRPTGRVQKRKGGGTQGACARPRWPENAARVEAAAEAGGGAVGGELRGK